MFSEIRKFKINSVRFRLIALLILAGMLLIFYFTTLYRVDNQQKQGLYESRLRNKQQAMGLVVDSVETQLRAYANDYTYWDDMVSFVNNPDKNLDFAKENIDASLSTYDTDVVWVFNKDHKLIYTASELGDGFSAEKNLPATSSQISAMFPVGKIVNYDAQTDYGPFEISAASIHPTNDADRKTKPQGYFFAGKSIKTITPIINKTLSANTEYSTVVPSKDEYNGYTEEDKGQVTAVDVLKDYKDIPFGAVYVHAKTEDLVSAIQKSHFVYNFGFIVFALIIGLSLLLQIRNVIIPMGRIQRALSGGDPGHLGKLLNRNDEFGSIARLVSQSFEQQRLLTAQKQVVEKEVEARTKELQNEEAMLKTLVDSMPVGVYMASAPDGKPILMNEIGVQILGRNLMEDTDKDNLAEKYGNIKEDGSPYPSNELPLNLTLATRKRVLKDDIISLRPDGSRAYLRIVSAPIINSDGSMPYVVAIFEDITKERDMERSRDEFFSIASHELRTPLTAIRGNTSMIKQYYADSLKDPELKEMIDDIHESSIRLIDIVNDFLDTSRLEQRKVKFEAEELNLAEVAKNVIKEYSLTGLKQKVHLRIEEPKPDLPNVWADKDRTKQIIINLVGNALKFTLDGSITISFEKDGAFVKTYVKDTGAGMDEDAQAKLFRKFEQTNKKILTRDSVQGTGLGLYISKMIVEQMGGHIKLESSKLGQGTVFSFTLPITKPEVK